MSVFKMLRNHPVVMVNHYPFDWVGRHTSGRVCEGVSYEV